MSRFIESQDLLQVTLLSLTDPDARAMSTNGRHSGIVGYNVQAAVDAILPKPMTSNAKAECRFDKSDFIYWHIT